ncbi:MAG: hypothetical protein U0892_05740 [Pirellulales bacterium]
MKCLVVFCVVVIAIATLCRVEAQTWNSLPSIPDTEGFAGAYAGVAADALLIAGGANFPDKKPWEGGIKVWYDTVYALDRPDAQWRKVGRLPRPLGYGVSVTYQNEVICVGGSDATRHYADCFRIGLKERQLKISTLPNLPEAIANCSGALVGHHLYVMGGQSAPTSTSALSRVWRLDLSKQDADWEMFPKLPGAGRIFPVAAAVGDTFFIVGGASLDAGSDGKAVRTYLRDAYAYDPNVGWKRQADCPSPIMASPSPAPAVSDGFVVLGGDDGSQVGVSAADHRGFSRRRFQYHLSENRWTTHDDVEHPRVTVPCVVWHDQVVVPSGEMRPGIRSPEVKAVSLDALKGP